MNLAEQGKAKGHDPFPIWGLGSLGMRQLLTLTKANPKAKILPLHRRKCEEALREAPSRKVQFEGQNWKQSIFGRNMTMANDSVFNKRKATFHDHGLCIDRDDFKGHTSSDNWKILTTTKINLPNERGVKAVSTLAHKERPIWASLYRPDMNAFDWSKAENRVDQDYPVPHDKDAIKAMFQVAKNFVQRARFNYNSFQTWMGMEKHIVFQYSSVTVKNVLGRDALNLYLFK